jgi:hypothetical protein
MNKKNIRTHIKLPALYFSPNDVIGDIMVAVATDTCKGCHASTSDLEIYKLYDVDDNSFWGTCYALKIDDVFYGNIQGSNLIISFDENVFKLVKTDELWLPIEIRDDDIIFIVCKYEKHEDGFCICPIAIKKANKPLLLTSSDIHVFNDKISVMEAIEYFEKNLATK